MTNTATEEAVDEAGLTVAERETLRTKLMTTRENIKASASARGARAVRRDNDVGDEMDQATSSAATEDAYAHDERSRGMLAQIERALSKLERNEGFGLSEESGEPIGFRRLQAVPWARLTIAEEEAAERRARSR